MRLVVPLASVRSCRVEDGYARPTLPRSGELNAFDADQVIFQYSRAATELWKFCNLSDAELISHWIDDGRAPAHCRSRL